MPHFAVARWGIPECSDDQPFDSSQTDNGIEPNEPNEDATSSPVPANHVDGLECLDSMGAKVGRC